MLQKRVAELLLVCFHELLRRSSCALRVCEVALSEQKKRLARFMRWCPPQAPLRADPLLSCGARNRQRTAAGQRAGSAPEQGMWLAGATSFRRALGPWGPGGKSPPQAPKSPPQAPLSEIRRAERPSPLTKWPQIRLHARHGRDIEDPEVAVRRRGDGAEPRSEKCEIITSASDQTAC